MCSTDVSCSLLASHQPRRLSRSKRQRDVRLSPVCIELINLSRNQATNQEVTALSEYEQRDDTRHDWPGGARIGNLNACLDSSSVLVQETTAVELYWLSFFFPKESVRAADLVIERPHLVG